MSVPDDNKNYSAVYTVHIEAEVDKNGDYEGAGSSVAEFFRIAQRSVANWHICIQEGVAEPRRVPAKITVTSVRVRPR